VMASNERFFTVCKANKAVVPKFLALIRKKGV
jgi:hypothetical protein